MTMSAVSHQSARLLVWSALAVLAACASLGPQLPMAPEDDVPSQGLSFPVRTLGPDGEFELLTSSLIARQLEAQLADRPLSILALSGGGASGAFGAGAVVGVTRSGSRPEFSVVTGGGAGAGIARVGSLGATHAAEPRVAAIEESGRVA